MKKINFYFLEFALSNLLKYKTKTIFSIFVLGFLVFILTSVFQVSYALKSQLLKTTESLPDIIIKDETAGFHRFLEKSKLKNILQINGVQSATNRIWGYYTFKGHTFTILGIDPFEVQYKKILNELGIENKLLENSNNIIVGSTVAKILKDNFFDHEFNFIDANGVVYKTKINSIIKSDKLLSRDLIIMNKSLAHKVLNIDTSKATDMALVAPNYDETDTIIYKIQSMYPSLTITSKEQIKQSYMNMIDYKGGLFISLFIISLFTFFIIIYDKTSIVSSSEKKEIAILKALGWSTNHILIVKFYEGFIISSSAYLLGVIFALLYVYSFDAYMIKDIFIGFKNLKSNFELEFTLYFEMFILVFLLSVPIYLAATIFPSWKIAITDVDEVLR